MDTNLDDVHPASNAVAEAWHEFQQRLLDSLGADGLSPEARGLARACFYFGSLAMLGMLESTLGSGPGAESLTQMIEGFYEEIALVIEQGASRDS